MALETSTHMKTIELAIAGLNRLIPHRAISASHVHHVVRLISDTILEMNNIGLKSMLSILQMMVALLTPSLYALHQDDLSRALSVCFRLHANNKWPALHQPAEASLRQVCSMLVERTHSLYSKLHSANGGSGGGTEYDLSQYLLDTTRLLRVPYYFVPFYNNEISNLYLF